MTRHTEIVRYNDDTTFVFLDCPCEGINGGHIQVVSGFICRGTLADEILHTSKTYASVLTKKEDVRVFHS